MITLELAEKQHEIQSKIWRRQSIHTMFHPHSVALIGATDREGSVGRTVWNNLIAGRARGELFPVNPGRQAIGGMKCYPTISSLPYPVDLAVIVTPAQTVPDLIRECMMTGVRSTVVISAGYRERGAEGAALEQQIAAELRGGNMALVGPNCLGIMNPLNGLNATFAEAVAKPGNVAFISQSGALCTAILDWSFQEQVGFSAFVSTGSMLDVGWGDLIRYFGDDPNTKSILLYIESIQEGADFLAAAKEVSPHKPIIAIKAGRTSEASRAASSHTGALTGNDEVLDAAFRHCGVLRVDRIADLFYMAEILSKQPQPKGPKLMIVTNAGGPGVLATDALIESGGELAKPTPETIEKLNAILPAHWSHGNPIDILGDADNDRYSKTLEIAAADPNTDGLLAILAPQGMSEPIECAKSLLRYAKTDKPVIASWMGGVSASPAWDLLNKASIPTFSFPDTAARAFTYMWDYSVRQKALRAAAEAKTPNQPHTAEQVKARKIIAHVKQSGRKLLTEFESKQLLDLYGISVVKTNLALTAHEAVRLAEALGYPVVVKLNSETITHKSDVGGVRLNLKDAAQVFAAFNHIKESVTAKASEEDFLGVTVQKMLATRPDAYELILGSSTDAQFGPIVLFGAGGQLTEIFKDSALSLPPLNNVLAEQLVGRTRISKALRGTRGRDPVDLDALYRLLIRFSELIVELPEISECDINPVIASPAGVMALDARIVLK